MFYTYETVAKPHRRFELNQSMKDDALTKHPETGVPIRRIVTGGCGFKKSSCQSLQKLTMNDCKASKHYNPNKPLTVAPGGIK